MPSSFEEKTQLLSAFFADAWDTPFTREPDMRWRNGVRPENPPTAEDIRSWIDRSTFPGIELAKLDSWCRLADAWFFGKTLKGDNDAS